MTSAKNQIRDHLADCLGDGWMANKNVFAHKERAVSSSIKNNGTPCRALFMEPGFSERPQVGMGCCIWRKVFTIIIRDDKKVENANYDLTDWLMAKLHYATIPPFSLVEVLSSNPVERDSFDREFSRWEFDLLVTGSTDPIYPNLNP